MTNENLVAALDKFIDEHDLEEVDGAKVRDFVDYVELAIAFTPVCPHPQCGIDVPEVAHVTETAGGERYIVTTDAGSISVSAHELKRMRARYLLWRGYYSRAIPQRQLSYPDQQAALARFFPDGLFHLPGVTDR